LAILNSINAPLPPGIDHEQRLQRVAELLILLEKVNFRLYILPKIFSRADSKQADLFWYAHELYSDPEWTSDHDDSQFAQYNQSKKIKGNIFDWVETQLVELVQNYCPIPNFVEALTIDENESYDFYNWRDSGLRYFLARYEEELQKSSGKKFDLLRILKRRDELKDTLNEYLSVEHIWARGNWDPPFDYLTKEKRRLGNLVLMGLSANIQQSADDLPVKVQRLIEENEASKGSLDMHQVADLKSLLTEVYSSSLIKSWKRKTHNYYQDLSKTMNDLRENNLIKFALKAWKIKGDDLSQFIEVDSEKAREMGRNEIYFLKKESRNK
jgi:hypothetical protein